MGPFRHGIRVRYSECDAQAVAFNANYLVWADDTITELWRAAVPGGYKGMEEQDIDIVVAEATVRYRSPARFDDLVDIELLVTRLGTTGMTTQLTFSRAAETLAEVELRHVFVKADLSEKRAIPDEIRSGLGQYAASDVA